MSLFGHANHRSDDAQNIALFQKILALDGLISDVIVSPPEYSQLAIASCRFDAGSLPAEFETLLRCGGAGVSEIDAIFAALGEAVERYASVSYCLNGPYHFGTARDFPSGIRCPSSIPFFSNEQYADPDFPFSFFDEDSKCRWYFGKNLGTGENVPLPGPFVTFPYCRRSGEKRFCNPVSTGLAFGASKEEAIVSGFLECIERDAFSLAWNWGIPATPITVERDASFVEIIDSVGLSPAINLLAYDITTDLGIPCCVVFLFDDDPPNHTFFSTGSSCKFSIELAFEKALIEAAQGIPYISSISNRREYECLPRSPEEIANFEDSAIFYSINKGHLEELFRVRGAPLRECGVGRRKSTSSILSSNELAQRLIDLEYESFFVDFTPEWLEKLGGHVGRTFIPKLSPLEGCYSYRSKNSLRALECSQRLHVRILPDCFPHSLP